MKIAHVLHSMEVGGAETLVATMCRLQRAEGHRPSVHCLFSRGRLGERLAAEGFPVYLHGPGPPWRVAARLSRRLRAERPEAVHCHNVPATILGAPAARLAGIRGIVVTRHGLVKTRVQYRRELEFWLAARLGRRVVAVCRSVHEALAASPCARPDLIQTIYNCASAPARTPGGERIEKRGFTLVNVARHTPEKDLATLLEALAIARRSRPDLHLWLIGSGALTEELKEQAAALGLAGCAAFLGERANVGDWLDRADLFVMSSVSEGLPVALLEAMEAGLPQVVTEVGGMPEVIALSRGGVLVPPRDPAALAARIVELSSGPERLAELGSRSRLSYIERFAPERMTAAYLRLYADVGQVPGLPSA